MNIKELIDALDSIAYDHNHGYGIPVLLFADMEGMSMDPQSVSVRSGRDGKPVVLVSAWEPSGDEFII
jgi:hypothetical protein